MQGEGATCVNRYLARPHRRPCRRPSGSAALPCAVLKALYTDVPYHIYLYIPNVPYVYIGNIYVFPMFPTCMYVFPMYVICVPYVCVPYVPYVCRPHRRPCRPHRSPHRRAGRPHGVYCTRYIYPVWFSLYIIETVSIINSYRELEAYRK